MDRTYTVGYVTELGDQSTDLETEVTVPNIHFVIPQFDLKVRVYRRITSIIEKPLKPKEPCLK